MRTEGSISGKGPAGSRIVRLAYAVLPLVALAIVAVGIIRYGAERFALTEVPPVEELYTGVFHEKH